MIKFLFEQDLSRVPKDAVIAFGGTFDPPHEGHLTIMERLLPYFRTVIAAPTAQNPWKQAAQATFAQRQEMIRIIVQAATLPLVEEISSAGVFVSSFPYVYSEELVTHIRSTTKQPLYWAVGEDSESSVPKWRNWDKLGVPTVVLPITLDVHAESIRSGTSTPPPALNNYIHSSGLYRPADSSSR